jgi:hypothetical protein
MANEDLDKRLSVHEAICAQRYKAIEESFDRMDHRFDSGSKRMQKIEYLLYGVMLAVLLGPGAAAIFFKKLLGM